MTVTIRRDNDIPALLFGSTVAFAVVDDDRRVGTVAQFGGSGTGFPRTYRIVEAGSGVTVPDPLATYQTAEDAADAVVRIRQASTALDLDAETGLTNFERDLLDFETQHHWRHQGNKDDAVRATFKITAIRYTQIVNALLDKPEALAYAPTTVNRLRRLRDRRHTRRAGLAHLAP